MYGKEVGDRPVLGEAVASPSKRGEATYADEEAVEACVDVLLAYDRNNHDPYRVARKLMAIIEAHRTQT